MNLRELLVKSEEKKPVPVTYDKDWGVSFDMLFLSKPELQKLVGRHTKTTFNPKTHVREEELDAIAMRREICEKCVKGWTGVTYKWLSSIMTIDVAKIENIDAVLPFNQENLATLLEEAYGLDTWILDTVRDAANFQEKKKDAEVKN